MGAGQIGGLATLLDIDFNNAAGFIGAKADPSDALYVVYYLSHAMLFCSGVLIEAHVVLTVASCVFGERYKFEVFAGTHKFTENSGVSRHVVHMGIHRGYNHTMRWDTCSTDNIALLMLSEQYHLQSRMETTEFVISRIRYGAIDPNSHQLKDNCRFYGWGSRRNDDVGSVIECNGFLRGLMTTRLIDRPCGVGFLDMSQYIKFLTCGVDDSRDILGHDDLKEFEFDFSTPQPARLLAVTTCEDGMCHNPNDDHVVSEKDLKDPGPPTTHPTESGEDPYTEGEVNQGEGGDQQQEGEQQREGVPGEVQAQNQGAAVAQGFDQGQPDITL